MAQVSGVTLDAIARLRTSSFYCTELSDAMLFGTPSIQHSAERLLVPALVELRHRIDAVLELLESDMI